MRTHQLLAYADINLVGKKMNVTKKTLLDARKDVCPRVNAQKTKHMFMQEKS
jgi:hypothetical protein